MTLPTILNLANDVDGGFLDLGFGYGNDSKEIYNLMLFNQIKKRNFTLIDQFKGNSQGIWQKAHDQVNEVKNRLKKNASYYKVEFPQSSFKLKEKFAIVNLDLVENTKHGLKFALEHTNKGGVIILRNYSNQQVLVQISDYLKENKLLSEVLNKENYYYIIVKESQFTLQPKPVQRTRSVLT